MIESQIFKLSATAYMRLFFPIYLRHKWWILILVVAPFVGLSFLNVKFLYVSLMALFFIIPLMMGFAYFYYATGLECVNSIRKCRIETSQVGFLRVFLDDDNNETGRANYNWGDYNATVTDKFIMLQNKYKRFNVQIIPLDAFECETARESILKQVEQNTRLPKTLE